MDIGQIVEKFGFPIAVAIYFIWQNGRIEKEHKADIKTIATQAVEALNKNTESDKAVTEQLVKNNTALERSEGIMSRIEGFLTGKEQRNGNRGA